MKIYNELKASLLSVGIPAELALVIRILEEIGGILLKVGLVTRITLILFIIEMIGAIISVKASNNFMAEGGYEVDLLLMLVSISLLL